MAAITPLPTNPDAISPEWLTEALRSSGALPAGSVTAVEASIIGAGIGFIGTVARLKLTYSGAPTTAPSTIIAKLPSEDPGSRMVGVAFGLYEREVRFYGDLAASCGLDTPKPFFSHYDSTAGQAVLLLEDLDGGEWGDQVAGATPQQAAMAIDAIGAFHARWWMSPDLDTHPWITSGIETIRQPIQMMYEGVWRTAIDRFGHLFPADILAHIPDFGRRTMAALDQLSTGPETLCHGDYRPDNLFYGAAGSARPLVVCDWQGPGRAPGVVDSSYFITSSLSIENRRAHEDELLRRYHNHLLEGGVKNYTLEQLHVDYRGYFAGIIAGVIVLLGTLPEGNDRGRALIENTASRFIAAMQDHDSLSLLPE